jgi:O-antigen/teichoic acid export membrane protein
LKKHFLTNLALLIFLNLLIKPFWFFGIEVGVQNQVGEESYGFYFSLFNFAFILNMLLDVGINNYNNRAIARDPSVLKEHLAAIVPLKLFLAIIYGGVVLISGKILGYTQEQFQMLWILVLNQFLASFILYFRTNISGLQLYRTDSILSVMDRSLMILFTGLLLWGKLSSKPFQIEWFVYAQTLSYTITLITVAGIVRVRSGLFFRHLSLSGSLKVLRSSYPFALLILLMALFNRVDSVMLERMLDNGMEEAGIYAQSFRIFEAATQFSLLFAMLLLPMFSKMIKQKEDVNELIRTALPLLMVTGLSVVCIAYYYNFEIIDLLYKAHAPYSSRILCILMGSFVFVSVSYLYGTLLTANHNLRQLNLVAALTVLINIGLNLLLIPRHQALGAAISSLVSQGFFALTQMLLSIRLMHLPSNRDILIKLAGFLAINMIAGYLSLLIPGWIPGILVLTLSCAASAMLLGLLRPSALRDFFRA